MKEYRIRYEQEYASGAIHIDAVTCVADRIEYWMSRCKSVGAKMVGIDRRDDANEAWTQIADEKKIYPYGYIKA